MVNKQKKTKMEAERQVLKCIEKSYKTVNEIVKETGIHESTIYSVFKRYKDKNIIDVQQTFNEKRIPVKKFRYLIVDDHVDPKYLKFIMKRYENALKENISIAPYLLEEITRICHFGKILDEDFINFLIDHAKKGNDFSIGFIYSLSKLAEKYKEEIKWNQGEDVSYEEKLLKKIQISTDFVYDYAFDRNLDIDTRIGIFKLFPNFNWKKTIDTTYKLYYMLNTVDKLKEEKYKKDKSYRNYTEFEFFKNPLRQMIIRYSNVDYVDCRDRLYSALEKNIEDPKIRSEIYDLWYLTNYGIDQEIRQSRFQSINPNDAIKYQELKNKLKNKGINIDE